LINIRRVNDEVWWSSSLQVLWICWFGTVRVPFITFLKCLEFVL
jgi:hypothetical protein